MRIVTKISSKVSIPSLYFVLVSLLSYTFLRKWLILLFPFIILAAILIFDIRVTRNVVFISLLVMLAFIGSQLLYGFHLLNALVSFALIGPALVFFLSSAPRRKEFKGKKYFEDFMRISSRVLLFVDFTALFLFLFYVINGRSFLDDSFIGIYGLSGLIMHTLCIMNFIYMAYFYFQRELKIAAFFLLSGLLCFFGTATVLLLISIVIYLIAKGKFIRQFAIVGVLGLIIIVLIGSVNKKILPYYQQNIERFITSISSLDHDLEIEKANRFVYNETPRKLVFYAGAYKRIIKDPLIVLFGTGPGTYSSRASFLLNGDHSKIGIIKRNIQIRPRFAEQDVFPLWNSKIVGMAWMNGSKNEPWSSIVSFLVEYGVIISLAVFLLIYRRVLKIRKAGFNSDFFLFTSIFLILLLLTDNYLEYPEVSLPLLMMFKTVE